MAILPYFSSASIPPAFIYNGDKIFLNGLLPGHLSSNIDELSVKEQAGYRLGKGKAPTEILMNLMGGDAGNVFTRTPFGLGILTLWYVFEFSLTPR